MRTTASTATSVAEFRLIADSLAHIVWTAAPDGSTEYFNRQAAIYCGSRTGVTSGWEWQSLVHPDDADQVRTSWDLAIRTQAPFLHDLRIRRLDREYRWHAFRCLPVRNEDGAMLKWVCTATDIQAAKQLEGDLRMAERTTADAMRFQTELLAAAGQAIVAVDLNRTVIYWNRAAEEIYGWSAAEAMGRQSPDLIVRDESPDQHGDDDARRC